MDSGLRGKRIKALTADTANALHVTILGLVDLTKTLLKLKFRYVLLGKLQSDRIEGEFGVWRGMCGGNFFISVEQIQFCLNLRTIKLFDILDIEPTDDHQEECCLEDLNDSDADLELIVDCFVKCSNLTKEEKSILYYICGYVAKKEKLPAIGECPALKEQSEFTTLVSRGKLTHPPAELYELSTYCFTFFKSRSQKCCTNIYLQAFKQIYQLSHFNFESNVDGIIRRLVNSFFSAFAKSCHTKSEADKRQTKKRRIAS